MQIDFDNLKMEDYDVVEDIYIDEKAASNLMSLQRI